MKNITYRPHQLIVLAIAGLATASTCNAEVIHNSLGPGDTYSGDSSWGAGEVGGSVYSNNAVVFEVGSSAFTDIWVTMPLIAFEGTDYSYSVRIYADNGVPNNEPHPGPPTTWSAPGSLVAEYVNLASTLPTLFDPNPDAVVVGFDGLTLEENTRYWLSVEVEFGAEGSIDWYSQRNDLGFDEFGHLAQSTVTTSGAEADYWNLFWQTDIPAFRVEGTAVPTPGSMAILGMMGAFASRRRRTA